MLSGLLLDKSISFGLLLVEMPFVTKLLVALLLLVRPGAPSSVLVPSSDALCYKLTHRVDMQTRKMQASEMVQHKKQEASPNT